MLAHSVIKPRALGGKSPYKILKSFIPITALYSPYIAWKCGGLWSS